MYACSIILPLSYLVGLLFTLKTHSYIFENVEPDEQASVSPVLAWDEFSRESKSCWQL